MRAENLILDAAKTKQKLTAKKPNRTTRKPRHLDGPLSLGSSLQTPPATSPSWLSHCIQESCRRGGGRVGGRLLLPLPTCSCCSLALFLWRKASRRRRARTSMIYEPSVASDVPVASDRMFPAGIPRRSAWALLGRAKVRCN